MPANGGGDGQLLIRVYKGMFTAIQPHSWRGGGLPGPSASDAYDLLSVVMI